MKHRINLISSMVIVVLMALSCTSNEKKEKEEKSEKAEISKCDEAKTSADDEEKLPVIIDFYADWCGPCQAMKPIFSQLSVKYSDKVNFLSINVDEESAMANEYKVEGIPTFVFIDANGKEIYRIVGSTDEKSFEDAIISTFGL